MPSYTPSYVKNIIRGSLSEIINPSPSEKEVGDIWSFFDSRCAYCGKKLDKSRREGHIDHLIPKSVGGVNHISNRVLACGTCNGDEKRDAHWAEFIIDKYSKNRAMVKLRIARIKTWQALNTPPMAGEFQLKI
jgi:5-methylcytosine-specific restriction endonuclease McrA